MINALFLVPGRVSAGITTYLRGLVDGLMHVDTQNTYILVCRPEAAPTFQLPSERWRLAVSPAFPRRPGFRWAAEQVWLPHVARQLGADAIHSTCFTMPLRSSLPSVVTIHDMGYKRCPESFPLSARLTLAAFVPRAARRSDHIVTVSEAARADILRWTGAPPTKVTAVPLAPRRQWPGDPTDDAARLAAAGISAPFILSVAGFFPHKNLVRLVRAFPLRGGAAESVRLVLVGLKGRGEESLRTIAGSRPDLLRAIGWVDDALLASLYRQAVALAFPSLHEGFGLPIVEAMALGTPVLTSNRGAMAEVAGGAAELVDPTESEDIRRGLRSIVEDPDRRERLRQLGLHRAGEFSWDRTAMMTRRVYQRLTA